MKIDYGKVQFEVTSEVKSWFEEVLGANWFQTIDPLLGRIRASFNGEVEHVELYATSCRGILHVKIIERDGRSRQQEWKCLFEPVKNSVFSLT